LIPEFDILIQISNQFKSLSVGQVISLDLIAKGDRKMLSAIISTTSDSMTSTVSTITTIGVSHLNMAAVICLIGLLSAAEVLSASKPWNKNLAHSLNMAILPLAVAIIGIMVFNVLLR
jgi:hypothetical protein